MPRRITSEDVIVSLFSEEGFYEVGRNSEAAGVDSQIILSNGRQEIVVNILGEESCSSRSAIYEALMEVERLLEKFNGVVLAVPRKFVRVLDEGVLARHGVGLVMYDSMGAEEIVPPRLSDKVRKVDRPPVNEVIPFKELTYLRTEISRIMKILEELEAKLDRLEREQKALASKISQLEKMRMSTNDVVKPLVGDERTEVHGTMGDNLPSFLRDNPWVEILSRRT